MVGYFEQIEYNQASNLIFSLLVIGPAKEFYHTIISLMALGSIKSNKYILNLNFTSTLISLTPNCKMSFQKALCLMLILDY